MIPFYRPKFFQLFELVPKKIYDLFEGDETAILRLFHPHVLWSADQLRKKYGPLVVNDWFWGGSNHMRGFRPWRTTVGATWSQHKFGHALDVVPVKASAQEMAFDILGDQTDPAFELITCVEVPGPGKNWTSLVHLHFDVRNWDRDKQGILEIHP